MDVALGGGRHFREISLTEAASVKLGAHRVCSADCELSSRNVHVRA